MLAATIRCRAYPCANHVPKWLAGSIFISGPFSSSEMACCPPEERHRASVVDCAWNAAGDVLACAVDTGAVQFVTCGSGGGSFRSSFVRLPDAGAVRCVDWNVTTTPPSPCYELSVVERFLKWVSFYVFFR